MTTQCQALYVSDERRCDEPATSGNGLFCPYHAKQCYGLYKGYKRRNAQLIYLIQHPPSLLKDKALHELELTQTNDENSLQECYNHLLRYSALLDRVIRARRLHTSRFYALVLDWGHENYVNQLSAQKTPLVRAIERVAKRLAEVLYEKKKWFNWVRQLEEEEERIRDVEKKKVKQEAALFKRHLKEIEGRLRQLRAEEDEKRQAAFLEKTWREVQEANGKLNEDAIDDAWDPIEDSIEDERGNYIDLLRHFLWQYAPDDNKVEAEGQMPNASDAQATDAKNVDPEANDKAAKDAPKSKNAKKKARQKANANSNTSGNAKKEPKEQPKPGTIHIESKEEMCERLRVGQKLQDGVKWVVNHLQRPEDITDRSPPLKPEEIDQLVQEITEIKELLFCRYVLAHAVLLPVALRSNSIEEFLADEEITNTDLRDLCLKMEQPGLQDLRDACADFKREDSEDDPDDITGDTDDAEKSKVEPKPLMKSRLPTKIETEREKSLKTSRDPMLDGQHGTIVDFGFVDDQEQYRVEKIKVKVCGKTIYNYPSDKAMSRGGWLQFCVIAKDCSLEDAVALCTNWDEFHELVTLTMYNYFPASGWVNFIGSQQNMQCFKLGFFVWFVMDKAEDFTRSQQTGRHQAGPRQHAALEARNFVCGQMKRNDPVSRRFIQYIALQSCSMVMLVRDVKTGEVIVKPPEEQLWLLRRKSGMGRAAKNEWEVAQSVGPKFFEDMEVYRQWSLNFKEYYEIVIWDLEAGNPAQELFNAIQTTFFKAHRTRKGWEIYRPVKPILDTIAYDEDTGRSYDLKPGEERESWWESLTGPKGRHVRVKYDLEEGTSGEIEEWPKEWTYDEADRLEDEVLFPWEPQQPIGASEPGDADPKDTSGKYDRRNFLATQQRPIHVFEHEGPDLNRWALDLDTDEEVSETEAAGLETRRTRRSRPHRSDNADGTDTVDSDVDEDELDDELDDTSGDDHDCGEDLTQPEIEALGKMMNAWAEWRGLDLKDLDMKKDPAKRKLEKMKEQEKMASHAYMEKDWELFIDRTRAHAFKDSWHRSDLQPHAREEWYEYQNMLKAYQRWTENATISQVGRFQMMTYSFKLLEALGVDCECHRRISKDAQLATGFVSLFFKDKDATFLASEDGETFRQSLIFKQDERGRRPPDRRTRMSNKTRPKEDFKVWDDRPKHFPEEWHLTVRPILAWLYREGVINTSYHPYAAGRAAVLTEPHRPNQPDLFFDWRQHMSRLNVTIANPMSIQPLIGQAREFAASNAFARFSVLRIWSAPHFWPLMLGWDNRDGTSFYDGLGRTWEWKFIPKDMPCSEWSMHKATSDRLNAFEAFFDTKQTKGCKIAPRIDTILVMSKDATSCRYWTTAATFAINTRPWRLELDPWKSWINVDMDFLERLDKKWWE